jgi:hypothetical protein|tara:strand:+ start:11449 stop:11574 length:126 start_codon:yes stop_codon:yes gene_type:complete
MKKKCELCEGNPELFKSIYEEECKGCKNEEKQKCIRKKLNS